MISALLGLADIRGVFDQRGVRHALGYAFVGATSDVSLVCAGPSGSSSALCCSACASIQGLSCSSTRSASDRI